VSIIRVNQNAFESGEEYNNRLLQESQREFTILLSLLSSYFTSKIDGPNYARELKAMAIALARVRLMLSDIQNDTYFSATRGEYLWQVLTVMLFPKSFGYGQGQMPTIDQTDLQFRAFLQQLVSIYFKGSIPASIQKAVELVTGGTVVVRENFLEARNPASGLDISDEFGFEVDIFLPFVNQNVDIFLADKNIRLLLGIIRPAHTLYRLKYILQDTYIGQQQPPGPNGVPPQSAKVTDSFTFALSNYSYEDFRKFVEGISGLDTAGFKRVRQVVGEDHSSDF
jgi:hypothetical protein